MSREREFTLAIYANEYKQICAWVLKHKTLETGGDLFGLWSGERTAVVQLVLGPGKNCRRASHSFYQDVEYLEKVGTALTEKEGVCHIGEWHSHHTIGLKRPSGGDEGTVWRNMPNYGLNRFLLFIANIESRSISEVSVGCFLFETEQGVNLPVLQGSFHLLPNESPFRSKWLSINEKGAELGDLKKGSGLSVLEKGAECMNSEEDEIRYLQEIDTSKRNTMRPVMSYKPRREDAPAAPQETDTGNRNTMRPGMPNKRRREDEPVAVNMNEGEGRSQNGGRNVAAKEVKKRCPCPFCAVL